MRIIDKVYIHISGKKALGRRKVLAVKRREGGRRGGVMEIGQERKERRMIEVWVYRVEHRCSGR
jgi:hypothetical protein